MNYKNLRMLVEVEFSDSERGLFPKEFLFYRMNLRAGAQIGELISAGKIESRKDAEDLGSMRSKQMSATSLEPVYRSYYGLLLEGE